MHNSTSTVLWRTLWNVDIHFLLSYRMMKNYTVEYLSGVFCFVQTSDGKVVSVFHPRTEDAKVTNFKKGIASAFQTNFKGTGQEIETDPQSQHHSHYRWELFALIMVLNINMHSIVQLFSWARREKQNSPYSHERRCLGIFKWCTHERCSVAGRRRH